MNYMILIRIAWVLIVRPMIRLMVNDPNSDADEKMMEEMDAAIKELFE